MLTVLIAVAVVVYVVASALLFLFGANLLWFSWLALRRRHRAASAAPLPADDRSLPTVTVQLPLYNEPYVARRVIEAAARLDYPTDRLQIQVLDDSDDGSSRLVADTVTRIRDRGLDVEHVRRPHREGYKAGALGAGLATATGEFVAVFDADFVPTPDFLRRTVTEFADDRVAFVQGRWGHLNGDAGPLTRMQVPAIDGHFLVEQQARGVGGHWFNFNGTAGVWRKAAIADAGGWQCDTLTEDLDLSYRAHLRGWRGVYRPDVVVPAELPSAVHAFRRQQHRWARGSLECARKLLGRIWSSDARLVTKWQASLHLLAYGVHLLLLAVVLAYPAVVVATTGRTSVSSASWLALIPTAMSAAPIAFLIAGQRAQGLRLRPSTLAVTVVYGSGLMVNTARAAAEILFRPDPVFERTAKVGEAAAAACGDGAVIDPEATTPAASTPAAGIPALTTSAPAAPARRRPGRTLDRVVLVEGGLAVYSLATAAFAATRDSWGIAVYAAVFALGLGAVAVSTAWSALPRHGLRPTAGGTTVTPAVGRRS
ncbi:MAG: glycosyltransferase [Actinomycetota bacterium]